VKTISNTISSFLEQPSKSKKMLIIYAIQSLAGGMAFYFAFFLGSLKFSPQIIGFIVSGMAVGNIVGAFVMGKMSDRTNPFYSSYLSLLFQGVSYILLALTKSPFIIGISMFLLGASSYAYMAVSEYAITSFSGQDERKRACALSLQNVASNIGTLVGGIIIASVSEKLAFNVFVCTGIMLIIFSLYFRFENKRAGFYIEKKTCSKQTNEDKHLYTYSLFFIFILGIIFAQQRVGYPIFLKENAGKGFIDLILTVNALLIITFMTTVSNILVKKNHLLVMGLGVALLGCGMFLFYFIQNLTGILLICIGVTLGEMICILLAQLICFQSVKDGKQGKAMGAFKGFYALGTIIGASLGGVLQNRYGINAVWELCGVLGVSMFIICYLFNFYRIKSFSLLKS